MISSWKEDDVTISTVTTQSHQWKRPLIGGLLSASPLVFLFLLEILRIDLPTKLEDVFQTLVFGFLLPAFPGVILAYTNAFLGMFVVVLIWFGIGALIARLIRNNIIAVFIWVAIVGISIWITGGQCFYCF